jgi:hypothetical protein
MSALAKSGHSIARARKPHSVFCRHCARLGSGEYFKVSRGERRRELRTLVVSNTAAASSFRNRVCKSLIRDPMPETYVHHQTTPPAPAIAPQPA